MFTFQVRPDGGDEYEVKVTSRDVYVWEKTGRGRSFTKLEEDASMSDLYEICHVAAKRQQLFTGSLEEFTDTCDISSAAEEEPDPTQQDHSRGG